MQIWKKIKPDFWDHQDIAAGPFKYLFNFRRIWSIAVFLTLGVSLIPLLTLSVAGYNLTQKSIESEMLLRTARLTSNIRRTVSFFLSERKAAMDFIVQDNTFDQLTTQARLAVILENLKRGFGGFVDLGVIDSSGRQRTYIGPYRLKGKDYSNQEWFKEGLDSNAYVSDIFLGFRQVAHMVIAIKHRLKNGSFYVLRATLDTEIFNRMLSTLVSSGQGDAFIINYEGVLQTPSIHYGNVFDKIPLKVPEYSSKTCVLQEFDPAGRLLVIGYAYIADTSCILMIVKYQREIMELWHKTRMLLGLFLAVSIVVIFVVVFGMGTYMVGKIYDADQKRVMTLHEVEYSNKMASLGRLSAGVAHEINNPLAIINEKAGLMKDMLSFNAEHPLHKKLVSLVDSVISSVERCATITRRLLNFARPSDALPVKVNVKEIIQEVLGFLQKEAEYRSISVSIFAPDDLPPVESDRGKLQEIFLNLINNSFAAMTEGGELAIMVKKRGDKGVYVTIKDNGCGISQKDIGRVFEPFFSTKRSVGGTGLGLSITYGLIQELEGTISVQSEVGKGTSFIITLPFRMKKKKGRGGEDEDFVSG